MSNKPWTKLNGLDQLLRGIARTGPEYSGVQITIELVTGFELFNTRPYHNYETWSNGYRVRGFGVQIEREDLDEAVEAFCERVRMKRDDKELPVWECERTT